MSSIVYIVVGGTQNFWKDRTERAFDLFNEFMVLVICINLCCQTDYMQSLQTRNTMGWVYIAVCFVVFLVNVGPHLWTSTCVCR